MSFSLPTIPILSGSGSSVTETCPFEKRKGGISREFQRHHRHCVHSGRTRQSSTISEYDVLTETQLISREYSITSFESTSTTNYIHPACHKYSGSSTSVSGTKFGEYKMLALSFISRTFLMVFFEELIIVTESS